MNLPPLATWALVGACVAAFLGALLDGGGLLLSSADVMRAAGAVDAARVWQGEVWRLLSALFVHAGVWHLGLNLWVLWQVGRLLEPILGTARFVLVYLVSGIVGFAASSVGWLASWAGRWAPPPWPMPCAWGRRCSIR